MLNNDKIKKISNSVAIGVASLMLPSVVLAHSTPSELAELGLQDLINESIDETAEARDVLQLKKSKTLEFSYQYRYKELEGFMNGTKRLSNSEVLRPRPEDGQTMLDVTTGDNFPVLPTRIIQKAHVFSLKTGLTENLSLGLAVPYIHQSTEHESIVPDFDEFTIDSSGLGDIALNMTNSYEFENNSKMKLAFGLSLPTGSIDETGDTPRNGVGTLEQLPYTMQLGSGTFDLPLQLAFSNSLYWGTALGAKVRLGKNDRDYRLGNKYTLSTWFQRPLSTHLTPYASLSYEYETRIKGQDSSLLVANPLNPYPANITNPNLYGGQRIRTTLGLNITDILGTPTSMSFEVGAPIYQDLNGPQHREQIQASIKLSSGF